jgi:hypothetical protein
MAHGWNHGAVKIRSKRRPVGVETIHQIVQVMHDHSNRTGGLV